VLITNLRTGAQSAVPLKYFHWGATVRVALYGAGPKSGPSPRSPKSSGCRCMTSGERPRRRSARR
jgi:hypothetical protein